MSKSLKLADDLSLPLDAVTQTFLIVGKRGSGKSNTAARFVEQLHHARLPFVVLDPVDTWWGLKAGREGGRGLDVYVFGGRKADLPLEAGGGALIAEVLCEHRLSMVLSVKHLSGRERSKFMVAFAQTLFQKWGGGPLHVVLEEAHELAPQMGGRAAADTDGEAAMLGAFKRLWKLGRSSGIGGTAVTQRPASLSKDITTQSEILVAHRTIGPQDVKAIGEWVKYHGEQLGILAELPTLPTGEAFVWAPEFPEGKPIGLTRTNILLRETYDSASTPKVGEQRVEPKELAAVDLERLRSKMAATIEKAKADDPRELKKTIAGLQKDLANQRALKISPTTEKVSGPVRDVPVLTDADRELLKTLTAEFLVFSEDIAAKADLQLSGLADRAKAAIDEACGRWIADVDKRRALFLDRLEKTRVQRVLDKLERVTPAPPVKPVANYSKAITRQPQESRGQSPNVPARQPGRSSRQARPADEGGLKQMHRAMLTSLAQHPDGLTKKQILIHTGYASSGPVSTAFALLVSLGAVEPAGAGLRITDEGRQLLGPFEPLPLGDDLREHLLTSQKLSTMERALLAAVCEAYPNAIRKGDVLSKTNYASSGPVSSAFAKLVGLGYLASHGPALLRASEELFS